MKNKKNIGKQNSIVIYKEGKDIRIDVHLDRETVWLTQAQIALLFGTQRPAITKHLKNIFEKGELAENSVSSILELTADDGKKYKTNFYNLEASC